MTVKAGTGPTPGSDPWFRTTRPGVPVPHARLYWSPFLQQPGGGPACWTPSKALTDSGEEGPRLLCPTWVIDDGTRQLIARIVHSRYIKLRGSV